MLTTIEKVIFLQEIDAFANLNSEDLAHIASISEEVSFSEGSVIYRERGNPDSMYLIINGKVRLHQGEHEVMIAGVRNAFGTWALFDDEPRVVTATTIEDSHLLRIDKEDFIDLLADNVQITQGILKSFVGRIRGLMERATRNLNE